jgi:hypothetical protein
MAHRIGAAREYYRLRVTRMDLSNDVDLEWRDDILYRNPPNTTVEESESWRVEAVNLDDDDDVVALSSFATEQEAYESLSVVAEELDTWTVSMFEDRYVDPARRAGSSSDT